MLLELRSTRRKIDRVLSLLSRYYLCKIYFHRYGLVDKSRITIKIIPNKKTTRRIFRLMTNLEIAVCLSVQFWPLLPRFNRLSQRIPIVVGFSSISISSRELRFTVRPKQEATCSSRGMSESCGKSVPLLGPTSTYLANPLSSYRDCYLGLPSISTFTTKDALFRE